MKVNIEVGKSERPEVRYNIFRTFGLAGFRTFPIYGLSVFAIPVFLLYAEFYPLHSLPFSYIVSYK